MVEWTKKRGDVFRCFGRNAAFPVVLVSTRDNIITCAMAHYFCFRPPIVGAGIRPATHSFGLIREQRAFVINIPTPELVQAVDGCGTVSGRGGDYLKFARFGLTPVPAAEIDCSLIAECPVNIECRLERQIEFPERTWFLGEVVAVHEAEGFDPSRSLVYSNFTYYAVGPKVLQRQV